MAEVVIVVPGQRPEFSETAPDVGGELVHVGELQPGTQRRNPEQPHSILILFRR